MPIAVGTLSDLGYVAETTYGTIVASPQLKRLRRVSTSLNLSKEAYESAEIRSDRMTADMRHGVRRVAGSIEGELSVGGWDDFLEAAMGGTWTAGTALSNTQLTSVTSDSATKTFIFTGGDPVALGLRVGDNITFTGLAATANNAKNYTIVSFGGTSNRTVTVAETVVTDAVADSSFNLSVTQKKLLIGNTYRSFTIERAFTDIAQFLVFKGCRVNQVDFSLPPTGIVRSNFGIVGQDVSAMAGTTIDTSAGYTAAATNAPLAAVSGVLRENGIAMATVTGLDFTLNNNLDGKPVVGSNLIPDNLWGNRQQVTGTLTALFQDATMFNKFVNETESNLFVRLDDPNGTDFIKLFFPRIKYSGGDISDADPQGLTVSMPFTALAPSATGQDASLLVIQRSNA